MILDILSEEYWTQTAQRYQLNSLSEASECKVQRDNALEEEGSNFTKKGQHFLELDTIPLELFLSSIITLALVIVP